MNEFEKEFEEFLKSEDSNIVPVVFLFVGLTIGILELMKQTRDNLLKGKSEQCSK